MRERGRDVENGGREKENENEHMSKALSPQACCLECTMSPPLTA